MRNKFIWHYCKSCRTYCILCPKCNNNCCNAGYGQIIDSNGKTVDCDICVLAYQFQDICWIHNLKPKDIPLNDECMCEHCVEWRQTDEYKERLKLEGNKL